MRSFVVLVLALPLAACEDDRHWFGQREFVEESIEGRELVPETELRLRFAGHEIDAYGGCNSAFGSYHLSADKLVLDDLAMLEAGCLSQLGDIPAQEDWFFEFIQASPTYEL